MCARTQGAHMAHATLCFDSASDAVLCGFSQSCAPAHIKVERPLTKRAQGAQIFCLCSVLGAILRGFSQCCAPAHREVWGELLFFQCLDSYKTKTKKTRRKANKEKRSKKERKGGKQATNGWEKPVKRTLNCGINATHHKFNLF